MTREAGESKNMRRRSLEPLLPGEGVWRCDQSGHAQEHRLTLEDSHQGNGDLCYNCKHSSLTSIMNEHRVTQIWEGTWPWGHFGLGLVWDSIGSG